MRQVDRLAERLLDLIGGERWDQPIDLRERLDGQTSDSLGDPVPPEVVERAKAGDRGSNG